ncbi:MAG: rhomboid family intramembrane serine protease [Methylobacteriaceae bacterium]|nr:rhomboid family intramembrane serine protease [Methylobacteriaceae bacterium]
MQHSSPPGREPAFNLPGALLLAILALLAIHGMRSLLPDQTDLRLVLDYGFLPGRWSVALGHASPDELVRALSEGVSDDAFGELRESYARFVLARPGPHLWSFAAYAALHGSWAHVVLNCVWLAAFGAPVLRRLGPARTGFLALATAVGGALAHWLANPLGLQPMIGASAVVSGLMAAAALFAFDHPALPTPRGFAARMARLAANRTALLFLASWLAINVVVGLLAEPLGIAGGAGIAWEAHIGGLIAGLLTFPFLDRRSDPLGPPA